jgi:protein TonB
MSNVSIFEKKWLDLVFEGKNQKYGAYKLRQESSKTTFVALVFGISFLVGGTLVLSSFNSKPIEIPVEPGSDVIIEVTNIEPPIFTEKNEIKSQPVEAPTTITPPINTNFVVAVTALAVDPIITNVEIPKTNSSTVTIGGEGVPSGGNTASSGGGTSPENVDTNATLDTSKLDKQPLFPGGIKNFYEYVGRNFEKPEFDEPQTFKVVVTFVIEKDGSMTDISVKENPGNGLDKEAIRVLKSLKTKWSPGIKNGQAVRTQYNLPITVRTE